MNNTFIYIALGIFAVIALYIIYRKNFKILVPPSVCLVTGGVKTGKSLCCVFLSMKDYRKRHRKWWFKTHILKQDIEEPLYYTNTTCSFGNIRGAKPHRLDKNIVYITKAHLMREKRFNYASVIYINEASLLADNMDFSNKTRNVELSLFNKLIAHETRGGALYYDTQSPLDAHYSIKRVMSTYYFIEKSLNLFFFRVLYIREMINSENGVNSFNDDVETTTRKVLIWRWWYKKYDRYEFEYLTKDLEKDNQPFKSKQGLVSFNPLYEKLADKRNIIAKQVDNESEVHSI